jgi:hypothetical protein
MAMTERTVRDEALMRPLQVLCRPERGAAQPSITASKFLSTFTSKPPFLMVRASRLGTCTRSSGRMPRRSGSIQ